MHETDMWVTMADMSMELGFVRQAVTLWQTVSWALGESTAGGVHAQLRFSAGNAAIAILDFAESTVLGNALTAGHTHRPNHSSHGVWLGSLAAHSPSKVKPPPFKVNTCASRTTLPQALRRHRNDPEILKKRAEAFVELGEVSRAIQDLKKVLQQTPTDTEVRGRGRVGQGVVVSLTSPFASFSSSLSLPAAAPCCSPGPSPQVVGRLVRLYHMQDDLTSGVRLLEEFMRDHSSDTNLTLINMLAELYITRVSQPWVEVCVGDAVDQVGVRLDWQPVDATQQ
jgi:hypothetical protein